MTKPIVGVIGNAHRIENRFNIHGVGERNLRAVADVAGALPLMFAGTPDVTDLGALLDAVDGILLTGARANVHPTRFRVEPHPAHPRARIRAGAGHGQRRGHCLQSAPVSPRPDAGQPDEGDACAFPPTSCRR